MGCIFQHPLNARKSCLECSRCGFYLPEDWVFLYSHKYSSTSFCEEVQLFENQNFLNHLVPLVLVPKIKARPWQSLIRGCFFHTVRARCSCMLCSMLVNFEVSNLSCGSRCCPCPAWVPGVFRAITYRALTPASGDLLTATHWAVSGPYTSGTPCCSLSGPFPHCFLSFDLSALPGVQVTPCVLQLGLIWFVSCLLVISVLC